MNDQPNQPTSTSNETIQRKRASRTGAYVVLAVVVVIAIVLASLYFAGLPPFQKASTSTKSGACVGTSLKGAGSTFVLPLMQTWYGNYSTSQVNYQGIGSGAGISQITAKTLDFGASDAPLNATQRAAAAGILEIPESAGAVAIIYNLPSLTKPLNLTGAVLAGIYLGVITNWNDSRITSLNPGNPTPNQAITPVERADGSGTTYALTDFLSKDNTSWATKIGKTLLPKWPVGLGESGSSKVAATVASTTSSVGYVDLTYALKNNIKYAAIQNPSGKNILPTIANTLSAVNDAVGAMAGGLPAGSGDWSSVSLVNAPGSGDYPITTFTYVLVYQALDTAYAGSANTYTQQKAEDLVNWLHWMLTTGQTFSALDYYIPLPSNVVSADQTTVNTITYGGGAVPACT